jgi:hypothetical protein
MYRPFVLVGLGGSGGKTIRFVKRDLSKRLKEMGWAGGIPAAWQFLHIDTPTIPDGNELNDVVDQVGLDEYLGLVGDGVSFRGVVAELDGDPALRDEMVGWRIDPANLAVPIGLGAGQFRAVGRTVAMVQGKEIRNRLKASFRRTADPGARSELTELFAQTHPNEPSSNVPAQPIVIVISSLAGGTGAGLIMNVCDIIAESGECEGVFSFLYTPEVFGAMGGVGEGVYANSLAAISEILNGYWLHGSTHGGGVPLRRNADLTKAGGAKSLDRSGPSYPFLIGLQNASGNSFANAVELFGAVGSGLATTMTDHRLQGSLFAYEIANWELNATAQTAASKQDALVSGEDAGHVAMQGIGAFQGLGTSRLSIGLDFFEDYAAQRIAKDAARYSALAHVHSDEAQLVAEQTGTNDPDELAGHIAENQLEHFLSLAGLSELGPDRNQLKDALRPDQATRDALLSDARSTAYRLGEVGSGGTANELVWGERLDHGVREAARTYSKAYRDALKANVHRWVENHPQEVLNTVEDFISRHGLVVAAALVQHAVRYLVGSHGVVEELRGDNELNQYRFWSLEETVRLGVVSPVQGLGSKVDNSHQALVEGAEEGLYLMAFVGEAHICEVAASVAESFAMGFLRPLAAGLERESRLLAQELRGPVANWAEWADGLPPRELQPPVSEITLIEPDEFAATFDDLVAETYSDDSQAENRRRRLREEITSGSFLREDSDIDAAGTQAISVAVSWSPGTSIDPDELRPQSDAMFQVALTPSELQKRARVWMHQPNCAFDKLLSSNLRSYLGDDPVFKGAVDPETLRQRKQRFEAKLRQMLSVAEPLIGIDPTLTRQVNPALKTRTRLSGLPFLNHELESSVTSILHAAELGDGEVAEVLDDDASTTHVTALKIFNGAVSPLIISSLFEPISENWAAATGEVSRSHFWSRRRARVLSEFIPAPQEHIAAMCRGWFIGVALGVIDRKTNEPIAIGRPNDDPASFPYPALSSTADPRDQLAVVLESLALAYVLVSQEQSLRPLEAYARLRDLGADANGSTGDLYSFELRGDRLGGDLEAWISSGEAPGRIVTPHAEGESPIGRVDSFIEVLQQARKDYGSKYEELRSDWAKNTYALGDRPWWPGLASPLLNALEDLGTALEKRRISLQQPEAEPGL